MIEPPKPPLTRIMREGCGTFCKACGSTISRVGFMGLFGNYKCHNEECNGQEKKKEGRTLLDQE